MATIDGTGRPGYMYDDATNVWYEISGKVSTAANYQWLGAHQFDNNVTNNGAIIAKLKFNSFLNPAARLAAIPSPGVGLITFLQQDAVGTTINRFEFWDGSLWVAMADQTSAQTLTNKTLTSAYFIAPEEKWNISATAVSTTTTVDYLTSQNWQYTTASTAGACTINIRGNSGTTLASSINVGDSATFSFHIATGATTPAYFNSVQIDGTLTGVTTRWQYGSTPTAGTVSGYDMYSFTVIKTAATPTYTVLASICKW